MCRKQLLSLWLTDKGKNLRLSNLEVWRMGLMELNSDLWGESITKFLLAIPELGRRASQNWDLHLWGTRAVQWGVISGTLRRDLASQDSAWREGSLIVFGISEVEDSWKCQKKQKLQATTAGINLCCLW